METTERRMGTNRAQQSIEFYEQTAEEYDDERWSTSGGALLSRLQSRAVMSLLGEVRGKRILEVAVGTGRFAVELLRHGAEVTGVDSSPKMLEISVGKAKRAGLVGRYNTVEGNAYALPFSDASFDAAICINALNHIPDQQLVIREIARVVAPGGKVVTNYTNYCSLYLPVALYVMWRGLAWRHHVYTTWFSPLEILRLHRRANIKITAIRGVLHWPSWFESSSWLHFFRAMNVVFRRPPLGLVAPQMFVAAEVPVAST